MSPPYKNISADTINANQTISSMHEFFQGPVIFQKWPNTRRWNQDTICCQFCHVSRERNPCGGMFRSRKAPRWIRCNDISSTFSKIFKHKISKRTNAHCFFCQALHLDSLNHADSKWLKFLQIQRIDKVIKTRNSKGKEEERMTTTRGCCCLLKRIRQQQNCNWNLQGSVSLGIYYKCFCLSHHQTPLAASSSPSDNSSV